MRILVLAVAVLSGCATQQQREAAFMAEMESAARICHAAGFQPKTPEINQCALQLYSQRQADEATRRAMATQIGAQLLIQSQQPAIVPRPAVVCRQTYLGMVCT